MSLAVFFSKYRMLPYSRLYFFIHVGIGKPKHQPVCPQFIRHTYFSYDSFVMKCVVETLHMERFVRNDGRAVLFPLLYMVGIYIIVIIRIVLKSTDFISETVLKCLTEIDMRLMGIERAV